MTPNDLEILLHCHCTREAHPRRGFPAVDESIRSLLANDLIAEAKYGPDSYTTTERGAAHVAQLCSTPWPVAKWVDAQGRVIDAGI